MDNNTVNVELSLMGEEYSSNLRKNLFEEELKIINNKYKLKAGNIDIIQTYFVKNQDIVEVGFFIRNSLENNISFEKVVLVIQDKHGINVLSKIFDLKGTGIVPALSGRPFEVKFELNDNVKIVDSEEYTIKFGDFNNLKAFSSAETEIDNIPIDIPFEEEKAIRKFYLSLDTLKKDELGISLYKLSHTSNGSLECLLIIRNAFDKEAKLEKLPLTVLNESGIVIARKLFQDIDGLLKIAPNKSKLVKFEFSPNEVQDKTSDLSKCTIEYR